LTLTLVGCAFGAALLLCWLSAVGSAMIVVSTWQRHLTSGVHNRMVKSDADCIFLLLAPHLRFSDMSTI